MKIRITGLLTGQNQIEESVDPISVGLDPRQFPSNLAVSIAADKTSGRVKLAIVASCTGAFLCDRCGDDIVKTIKGDCEVVFVKRDEPFPDEAPGDDLRSFGEYQEYIDIATELHDTMMLAIPMKLLCVDECKGICLGCGSNLNRTDCRCIK